MAFAQQQFETGVGGARAIDCYPERHAVIGVAAEILAAVTIAQAGRADGARRWGAGYGEIPGSEVEHR